MICSQKFVLSFVRFKNYIVSRQCSADLHYYIGGNVCHNCGYIVHSLFIVDINSFEILISLNLLYVSYCLFIDRNIKTKSQDHYFMWNLHSPKIYPKQHMNHYKMNCGYSCCHRIHRWKLVSWVLETLL